MISPVSEHMSMDIEAYRDWFHAIRSEEQHAAVRSILDTSDEKEKFLLLKCPFNYHDEDVRKHHKGQCYQVHMPLAVAVCTGAMKVVTVLLKSGVDPAHQDCHGNTVLHTLILNVFYHPELEDTIMSYFHGFIAQLRQDQLKPLLHTQNNLGLRPLEFACQHGVCSMFSAIMEIPGVYRYKQETKGLVRYTWYDITEYETHQESCRRHLSPLWLLTFIDKRHLQNKYHKALLEREYVQKWCKANFRQNLPFIVLLFFIRLFYIVCYFIVDMDTSFYGEYIPGNTTDRCRPDFALVLSDSTRLCLSAYLMLHSCCIVIINIIEAIMSRGKKYSPIWYTVTGRKDIVVQVSVYRYANLIFAVFVIAYVALSYLGLIAVESISYFLDIARMVCPVLSVWCLLFFMQLLPSIGHFIIGVQQVIVDMFHFVLIYALMFTPFVHAFQNIINTKTNVGCIEGFTTLFDVGYSVFAVMLNLVDLKALDIRNIETLLVAHVVFTFLISIMMINFFIALLSNTVSSVNAHSKSAILRQRNAVSFLIESRLLWLCGPLYRRMHHLEQREGRVLLVETKYDTCGDKM